MHLSKDGVRWPLRIQAAPFMGPRACPNFCGQRIAAPTRPDRFDNSPPPVFYPFSMVIVQRDPIRELGRFDLFAEQCRVEVKAHKLLVFGVAAGSPLRIGKRAVVTGDISGQIRDGLANRYSIFRGPHCEEPRARPIECAFEEKTVTEPDEKDAAALLRHPKSSRS